MGDSTTCQNNYWAGAVEACKALGEDYELPPIEALQELYCRLKGTSNYHYSCSNITKDSKLEEAFTAKGASLTGGYWSSDGSDNAYCVSSSYGTVTYTPVSNNLRVMCLGE